MGAAAGSEPEIDIKKIVRDLLHDNLASDVTSSGKYFL